MYTKEVNIRPQIPMEAHLYLEAKLSMVGSATDFTYKWCINMGLDQSDSARMALATDEVLTDIVLYAYRNEVGYVEMWYQYSLSGVEIIIQEKGEPFDPGKHSYSAEKVINENDFEGASLETIRRMTDHFIFINRGKDGKEFRLVKRFESSHIREFISDDVQWEKNNDEQHPDDNYLLTPVTSEDAEDIAKLIYRSYNYTYSNEDLYHPKRIEMAIRHEYKFATIVRTVSGGPAGYFAVIKSTDSLIGEVGEAVVSPRHRKRGLMTRMMAELIEMSRQRGILGLFGMALTIHAYSQKVNERFGFKSTAMILAKSPKRMFRGMDINSTEIISVVLDFLPLTRRWIKKVILPDIYREILSEIYSQFENQQILTKGSGEKAQPEERTAPADLDLNIKYESNSALIIVRCYGSTFESSCLRLFKSLDELNLTSIYIDLPLNQERTDSAIQWLKEYKFMFAGLMPLFHKELDYLRMQKINLEIDFDKISTHTEIAGKLKKIIKGEYDAIQKKQSKT